jgi:hypothetical protein
MWDAMGLDGENRDSEVDCRKRHCSFKDIERMYLAISTAVLSVQGEVKSIQLYIFLAFVG